MPGEIRTYHQSCRHFTQMLQQKAYFGLFRISASCDITLLLRVEAGGHAVEEHLGALAVRLHLEIACHLSKHLQLAFLHADQFCVCVLTVATHKRRLAPHLSPVPFCTFLALVCVEQIV